MFNKKIGRAGLVPEAYFWRPFWIKRREAWFLAQTDESRGPFWHIPSVS